MPEVRNSMQNKCFHAMMIKSKNQEIKYFYPDKRKVSFEK